MSLPCSNDFKLPDLEFVEAFCSVRGMTDGDRILQQESFFKTYTFNEMRKKPEVL